MYLLTALGRKYLFSFLAEHVDGFDDHNQDDWVSHAEAVVMNTQDGDDFIIEVNAFESISGRPETLKIPRSYLKYHQLIN